MRQVRVHIRIHIIHISAWVVLHKEDCGNKWLNLHWTPMGFQVARKVRVHIHIHISSALLVLHEDCGNKWLNWHWTLAGFLTMLRVNLNMNTKLTQIRNIKCATILLASDLLCGKAQPYWPLVRVCWINRRLLTYFRPHFVQTPCTKLNFWFLLAEVKVTVSDNKGIHVRCIKFYNNIIRK